MRGLDDVLIATATVDAGRVSVQDTWREQAGRVVLSRRIEALPGPPLRVDLEIATPVADRYFVPAMVSTPGQHRRLGRYTFADDRLGYPVVASWQADAARVTWLARLSLAQGDCPPQRRRGDMAFRRDTDLGHIGFRTDMPGFLAGWPVAEVDISSQIDSTGSGFETYHGREQGITETIEYEFGLAQAATFSDAVRLVTQRMVALADPRPTRRGLGLQESVELRLRSAAKTYVQTPSGFAGFVLNFDPSRGYDSQAKAFGASFSTHQMRGSRDILEYGFTGRQLDIACSLAESDPGNWAIRGRRVVDSFVERLAHQTGWVATLFDLSADRPVYAIGDPRGTVMHYMGKSRLAGTYTRMMTEAGGDLVRNIRLHGRLGHDTTKWRAAAIKLARFLCSVQNADGSWYRAYSPAGRPIVDGDWFGGPGHAGKSATAAVVPYLIDVAALDPQLAGELASSAGRAGRYVQTAVVASAEYRGGTLDNPNDFDKEAALLAMRALLALERAGVAGDWCGDAVRAAWFAVGWHSLWPVPVVTGTPVARAGVRSVGWGGINSVWGTGVVDTYSLLFAGDLHRLGQLSGTPEFQRIAELIAYASLEFLSSAGTPHGLGDSGMQPEGMSFADQGRDDGLICKGDSWGSLGWPYTAGTTGMADYLAALDESRSP
ncbi:MAG: hypothetical protein LBK95_00105 [Bifidobacteriaceae bacterium]|nr:hypothetical protein [Bifidobacteriaceae bacterium]